MFLMTVLDVNFIFIILILSFILLIGVFIAIIIIAQFRKHPTGLSFEKECITFPF